MFAYFFKEAIDNQTEILNRCNTCTFSWEYKTLISAEDDD